MNHVGRTDVLCVRRSVFRHEPIREPQMAAEGRKNCNGFNHR
jgi:hypothetical protein